MAKRMRVDFTADRSRYEGELPTSKETGREAELGRYAAKPRMGMVLLEEVAGMAEEAPRPVLLVKPLSVAAPYSAQWTQTV